MSMNFNSSVRNLNHILCSVRILSTLNIILPQLILINAIMFHSALCIETMSLVIGLSTGSNIVFEPYLVCSKFISIVVMK